jgi:predicted permease
MHTLLQDVRYGLRLLLKTPGISLVALITLALGIGATAAIFTFVDAGLLRALNFPNPEQLVNVGITKVGLVSIAPVEASYPTYQDWRAQNAVFSGLAGFASNETVWHTGQETQLVEVGIVTDNFFSTLSVEPLAGRWLSSNPAEAEHELVLSYQFSRQKFGSDRAAVGQTMTLDDFNGDAARYTVVGIAPRGFEFALLGQEDMFASPPAKGAMITRRNMHWLNVVGRLKPGVTMDQAGAEMQAIESRLGALYPLANGGTGVRLRPLREIVVGDVRPVLLLSFGAAGFVLLIACANIANVLLAKAAGRTREVAIRSALGASRSRIARQFLTESVVLSLIAGGAALVVANFGVSALLATIPEEVRTGMPFLARLQVNLPVLLFTFLVAAGSGIVFGLAPAMRAARSDLRHELSDDTRTSTGRQRLRDVLVVGEAALAAMLLVGAGLLVTSIWRLVSVDPGFNRHNLLTLGFQPPPARYQDPAPPKTDPPTPQTNTKAIAYQQRVEQAIAAIPGVKGVAVTASPLPLSCDGCNTVRFRPQGYPAPTGANQPEANTRTVSNSYFSVLQARLLKGRVFNQQETDTSPRVVIVNRALADQFFGGDPIGKTLTFTFSPTQKPREIIGEVDEIKDGFFDAPDSPTLYTPYTQSGAVGGSLIVRTAGDPAAISENLRQALLSIDRDTTIFRMSSLDFKVQSSTAMFLRRLPAMLVTLFGALALLLAGIGVYGVVAYSVAQRTREFGIRMALGASARDVVRSVMGRGAKLAAIGAVIGLAGAAALVKVEARLLFGLRPADALAFVLVAGLISVVALAASYVPARRAARLDPMAALRHE